MCQIAKIKQIEFGQGPYILTSWMPYAGEHISEVLRAFIYSLQNTTVERCGSSDSFPCVWIHDFRLGFSDQGSTFTCFQCWVCDWCMYMCICPDLYTGCLPQSLSTLFFKMGSLSEPEACLFEQACWE